MSNENNLGYTYLVENGIFKDKESYDAFVRKIALEICDNKTIETYEEEPEEDWSFDKKTGWHVLDKVVSLVDNPNEQVVKGDKGVILSFQDDAVLVEFSIKNSTEATVAFVEKESISNERDNTNNNHA